MGPTWFLYKLFTVIALLQICSVYQLTYVAVAFYCCTSEKVQRCCMLDITVLNAVLATLISSFKYSGRYNTLFLRDNSKRMSTSLYFNINSSINDSCHLVHILFFTGFFSVTKREKNVLSETVPLTELNVIKVQIIMYCFVDLDTQNGFDYLWNKLVLARVILYGLCELGGGVHKLLLGGRPS